MLLSIYTGYTEKHKSSALKFPKWVWIFHVKNLTGEGVALYLSPSSPSPKPGILFHEAIALEKLWKNRTQTTMQFHFDHICSTSNFAGIVSKWTVSTQ